MSDPEPKPSSTETTTSTTSTHTHAPAPATTTSNPSKTNNTTTSTNPSATKSPHSIQIVSIGTQEDDYAFTYHEQNLRMILNKIPPKRKVALVSVVGAFRTGKSFILSWFLRYLHHVCSHQQHQQQGKSGEEVPPLETEDADADAVEGKKWYEEFETLNRADGFDWRGGAERNTSGMWMWSEPFMVKMKVKSLSKSSSSKSSSSAGAGGSRRDDLRTAQSMPALGAKRGGGGLNRLTSARAGMTTLQEDEDNDDDEDNNNTTTDFHPTPQTNDEKDSNSDSDSDEGEEEEVALLLVDTQGMFDHETTVALTASIFGLSTLLSSYQIYNVDKRIQEDNLQHLALFAEYGRMALRNEQRSKKGKGESESEGESEGLPVLEEGVPAAKKLGTLGTNSTAVDELAKNTTTSSLDLPEVPEKRLKPFQRLEFLVRDWQNFDCDDTSSDEEDEDSDDDEDTPKPKANKPTLTPAQKQHHRTTQMLSSMQPYLTSVLEHKHGDQTAADLKETREQILACFQHVSCFLLCHPGFAVTKKKYKGEVKAVESQFLWLLDAYCKKYVFGKGLQPKRIGGRYVTSGELGAYVKAYASMFATKAKFPPAKTVLDATAEANNVNATAISIDKYRAEMDRIAGPRCTQYVKPKEFVKEHERLRRSSVAVFDEMATFGSEEKIEAARRVVLGEIQRSFGLYVTLNDSRNPLMGIETYFFPMGVAMVAYILRWFADRTCTSWSQTCKNSADVLEHVYVVVFFFLVIVGSTKARLISQKVQKLWKAFVH